MPTNLLLLPFLGGYWFLHVLYYTRFRSQRLDGYRLLVESAAVGLLLAVAARLLVVVIAHTLPSFKSVWLSVAPDVPYLGTATVAAGIGAVCPYFLNSICKGLGRKEVHFQHTAIERHGNNLLRLLHSASAKEKMVSITLDNNKVYIGLIIDAPNLAPHDNYVSLIPFLSGYRVRETLELRFKVDYMAAYDEHNLNREDFKVVIPIANVRMASFFDHKVYAVFIDVESDFDERASAAEGETE